MQRHIGLTAVFVGLGVVVMSATALATSGLGVTSTPMGQGQMEPVDIDVKTGDWKLQLRTKRISDLSFTENRVAPGGTFGWHSHPGPSLVFVKSGTSTFYRGDDPDCTGEDHPAGTAYVDPGGVVHTARNEGPTELVVLVARLVPSGAAPRIDEPDPGNCSF